MLVLLEPSDFFIVVCSLLRLASDQFYVHGNFLVAWGVLGRSSPSYIVTLLQRRSSIFLEATSFPVLL